MSDTLTSRFIQADDPKMNQVILNLPKSWWSRPYEYAWASALMEKEFIVLDAACGICHPFKFYLSNICKSVYACDFDDRILSREEISNDIYAVFGQEAEHFPLEYLDKPHLSRQDISKTDYDSSMFDRIVCISVLEHLTQEEIMKTLMEFSRLIKRDGLIMITLDYPYLELEAFNRILKATGLTYAHEVSFSIPENALKTNLFPEFPGGLYSFRALLKKDVI